MAKDYKVHFDWESYPKLKITDDLLLNSATITIDTAPADSDSLAQLLLRDTTTGIVEKLTIGSGLSVAGGALTASGGLSAITADNGLTANTSSNVELGGTLSQNTTINQTNKSFTLNNSDGSYLISDPANNLWSFGNGSDFGTNITINDGPGGGGTNNSLKVLQNGVRVLELNVNTRKYILGNQDGGGGTILTVDDSAQTITLAKEIHFPNYGTGANTGTLTKILGTTSSGKVIETTLSALGGITGITANNGLTASTSTNVQLGGTLVQNTYVDTTNLYTLTLGSTINPFTQFKIDCANESVTIGRNTARSMYTHTGQKFFSYGDIDDTGSTKMKVFLDPGIGYYGLYSDTKKLIYVSVPGRQYYFGDIDGVGNSTNISIEDNNQTVAVSKRFLERQGTDVASTGAMVLSSNGNVFEITGTADINTISNLNWQNGSTVTLMFTSTAKLKNAQTSSGNDIKMLLAGAADFTASADDVVVLVLGEIGGTQAWREVSRSVN